MTDHSSNINAIGSTKKAVDAIKKNAGIVLKYPDYHNTNIATLVSRYFNVPLKNISIGAGSTQLLFDIPKILSYKRAVIIVPTFWEYRVLNERNKKPIKKIILKEKEGFEPDYTLIQNTIKDGDAVFICNVNNPTSKLYRKEKLQKLIRGNPNVHFVVDETYLVFRGDYAKQTLSNEAIRLKNVHIIVSLSKFFALPGIRLGVIISNAETITSYVTSVHIPYSIHPLSYVAFQPLLEDVAFTKQCREFYDAEKKDFYEKANKKLRERFVILEPDGNFILGRILTGQKSTDVVRTLSQEGILIRNGVELADLGESWIRFSLRSKKDNAFLLKKLDEILVRKS